MSNSGGGRTKKRGRAMALTLAGSPLVGRNMKRAGKSPAPSTSPKSVGSQGAMPALAIDESDIVLDRLEKEIAILLRAGDSTQNMRHTTVLVTMSTTTTFCQKVLFLVAMGPKGFRGVHSDSIHPHTRAHTAHGPLSTPRSFDLSLRRIQERRGPATVKTGDKRVLVCRDVRPPRLLEHLHALVSLTSTPHLILSASSGSLGRVFGCKTMAALAICPPRCSAPPPRRPTSTNRAPPAPLSSATNDSGAGTGGASTHARLPCGNSDGKDASARNGSADDGGADRKGDSEAGQGEQPVQGEADAGVGAAEGADQGRGVREGGGGVSVASDVTAHVDEGVDSLLEFLRRKVRVP
ncbi:unnamed protein product [Scytosiphon promiscuus]